MSSIASTVTTTIRTKSLRKSHSMPHISTSAPRHCHSDDDGGHGGYECLLEPTNGGAGGSCSLLDQIGFCGSPGSQHHHQRHAHSHHHHQHHHHQHHQHSSASSSEACDRKQRAGGKQTTPLLLQQHHQQPHRHRSATDAAGHHPHRAGCGEPKPLTSSSAGGFDAKAAPYSVRLVADLRQLLTLRQHYYPEGGWGWVLVVVCFIVQSITHGLHLALGVFTLIVAREFGTSYTQAVCLTAMSFAVGLAFSPVTISLCKRKSSRLVAVIGGLVAALGCLFTSFALQLHQVVFSFGVLVALGVNLTRDCSTVMVAQYFKKRRELVEVFVVAGSGAGVAGMTVFYQQAIGAFGWRLGLQAIAGTVFITFILGLFYRSASLYHPQRRAILHLKNQRRKVKDKNKQTTQPPFFDARTLHSKTVRIVLLATGITSLGLYVPIFHLARTAQLDGCSPTGVLHIHAALGAAWMLGCVACGALVVRRSRECRIGRQYLCQMAACVAGVAQLTLSLNAAPSHESYVMFATVYGGACGAWHYALKVYTYERVRARNFARAWSFVQCSQALPVAVGVPLAVWLGDLWRAPKLGYVWGAVCTVLGASLLFLVDVHRRTIQRQQQLQLQQHRDDVSKYVMRQTASGGGGAVSAATRLQLFRAGSAKDAPRVRRLSFSNEPENDAPFPYSTAGSISVQSGSAAVGAASATATALMLNSELLLSHMSDELGDLSTVAAAAAAAAAVAGDKAELTCISEEGIADMDLPDNLFDDYDYIGDCITSCNKV